MTARIYQTAAHPCPRLPTLHRQPPGMLAGICLLVGMLAGCVGGPPPLTGVTAGGNAELAVIERDWHTELGVPLDRAAGPLASVGPVSSGTGYLIVGFGDRAYFTDHDAGIGTAFAALFTGPAAIQLASLERLPEDEAHVVVRLRLSPEALNRVEQFIWNSLDRADDGTPREVVELNAHSMFYVARQPYDAFYNCNSWVAEALQAGGLPFDPSGTLFASQVIEQAQRVADVQASMAASKPLGGDTLAYGPDGGGSTGGGNSGSAGAFLQAPAPERR